MKVRKTNAVRLLDTLGLAYGLESYLVDENDLGAAHLARVLGWDIATIYKTLVLTGDKSGYFVCLVPGAAEVDLKKAARVSGNKNAALIPMKDLLAVTGYVRGGCSPLGMKKKFPTFIHHSAEGLAEILVSAGVRGLQIRIAPRDLMHAAEAEAADLVYR